MKTLQAILSLCSIFGCPCSISTLASSVLLVPIDNVVSSQFSLCSISVGHTQYSTPAVLCNRVKVLKLRGLIHSFWVSPKTYTKAFTKAFAKTFTKAFSKGFPKVLSEASPKAILKLFPKALPKTFTKALPKAFPKAFPKSFPSHSEVHFKSHSNRHS